jgi:hypothetical protein
MVKIICFVVCNYMSRGGPVLSKGVEKKWILCTTVRTSDITV